MESVATIKAWNPPRSFVAETEDGPLTVATEWTVEARAGGTCVVRVVHRWFASTDEWDDHFEGHTYGWQAFFRILILYLTHFPGERSSAFQLAIFSQPPALEIWRSLMQSLGVHEGSQSVVPTQGAPLLSGVVERTGGDAHPELLLRWDQPAPGLAHMFPMPMGEKVLLSIRFYLYGDASKAIAAEIESQWANWLAQQFPTAANTERPRRTSGRESDRVGTPPAQEFKARRRSDSQPATDLRFRISRGHRTPENFLSLGSGYRQLDLRPIAIFLPITAPGAIFFHEPVDNRVRTAFPIVWGL
jgi:hypothetical protein